MKTEMYAQREPVNQTQAIIASLLTLGKGQHCQTSDIVYSVKDKFPHLNPPDRSRVILVAGNMKCAKRIDSETEYGRRAKVFFTRVKADADMCEKCYYRSNLHTNCTGHE